MLFLLFIVTLYLINPNKTPYYVVVQGQVGSKIQQFLLQSSSKKITSTSINLNGKPLLIDKTNKYPKLEPKIQKNMFQVPSLSLGFWILEHANISECKS